MISINSSNNFLSSLKYNFRRHLAIFSVFQILIIVVSAFIVIDNSEYHNKFNPTELTDFFAEQGLPCITAVLCLEAVILSASMFSGIYNKRASDFYYSLPVKRSSWFNANFLFGIISLAVSYVLFYVVSISGFNLKVFLSVNIDTAALLKYTLISFAAVIVFYTLFVMCAVVAGRIWQYIFLGFISFVVLYAGTVGFLCYINTIYGSWINLGEAYTVSVLRLLFSNVTDVAVSKYLISAAVQFVVFYIVGWLAFKKRKAEVAENMLAGKVLPVVIMAVCFLAEVFLCLGVGSEAALFVRIFAALVAVAVTAVLLSAVFFRKAMSKPVLLSIAGTFIVSALCVLSVEIITEKTYVYIIPEKDEIKTVSISDYINGGSSNIIDILYGSSYLNVSDDEGVYRYKFSSDEAKEKVIQFHERLLADETRNNVYSEDYYRLGNTSICIEYELENGKKIKRLYDVSTKDILDEYADALKTDEAISDGSIFNFKSKDILFAAIDQKSSDEDDSDSAEWGIEETEDVNESAYENTVFIKDIDVEKLCECIKKDLHNSDPYRFMYNFGIDLGTRYEIEKDEYYYDSSFSLNSDMSLRLYQFDKNLSDADRARLEKLSPKEILETDDNYLEENNYSTYGMVERFYFSMNTKEDKNTVSYLEELGYKF